MSSLVNKTTVSYKSKNSAKIESQITLPIVQHTAATYNIPFNVFGSQWKLIVTRNKNIITTLPTVTHNGCKIKTDCVVEIDSAAESDSLYESDDEVDYESDSPAEDHDDVLIITNSTTSSTTSKLINLYLEKTPNHMINYGLDIKCNIQPTNTIKDLKYTNDNTNTLIIENYNIDNELNNSNDSSKPNKSINTVVDVILEMNITNYEYNDSINKLILVSAKFKDFNKKSDNFIDRLSKISNNSLSKDKLASSLDEFISINKELSQIVLSSENLLHDNKKKLSSHNKNIKSIHDTVIQLNKSLDKNKKNKYTTELYKYVEKMYNELWTIDHSLYSLQQIDEIIKNKITIIKSIQYFDKSHIQYQCDNLLTMYTNEYTLLTAFLSDELAKLDKLKGLSNKQLYNSVLLIVNNYKQSIKQLNVNIQNVINTCKTYNIEYNVKLDDNIMANILNSNKVNIIDNLNNIQDIEDIEGCTFVTHEQLLCPITKELMVNPVLLSDGFLYEKDAITTWLKNNNTSPMTNQKLTNKTYMTGIHLISSMIKEIKSQAC